MKEQYYQIYEDLLNQYLDDFYSLRYRGRLSKYFRRRFREEEEFLFLQEKFLSLIENELDIIEADFPSLRPDAKLFLIMNFHHMVVRPMILSMVSENKIYDATELSDAIKNDIKQIVSYASEISREKEEKEISGHSIMKSIDKTWEKLRTTKFEIWG